LTRPEVLTGILEGDSAARPNLCGMARPARHKIELGDEERSELERIARAEKRPWREVQRARIVLYAAEGKTDVEIAARLDTSAGIVGRWRRRFFEERLEGLEDRPRAGRPRRFSPAAGRRGQGDGLRAARHPRRPAVAL
jgi:Helix-turn-helix domain